MRAVKGRDTKPELKLRRILRTFAPGYRLHRKDIAGRPDVAYVGRKLAIFVHGCFWHGHDCARGRREPKANAEFWQAKIARNRVRDAEALARLAASGWRAEVIWECEMANDAALEERLRRFLKLHEPELER
jgi:DNA mismatch endonuclease (patch repair protein)